MQTYKTTENQLERLETDLSLDVNAMGGDSFVAT